MTTELADHQKGGPPIPAPPSAPPHLKWYDWLLVVSIDMLGPFSSDSYIPNMPELMADLSTSYALLGLTLQLNWICKGFSTLLLGSYSDKAGRRPVLLGSLVVYILGTAGCALAPHMCIFLVARIVQGIGEGCAAITSAVARDVLQDPGERMQMLAILGTIRPVTIIAAPSIGGLLGSAFGWRRVFVMLCVWGFVNMVCVAAFLPETTAPHPTRGSEPGVRGGIVRNFGRIANHRDSMVLVGTLSVVFGAPTSMLSNIASILEVEFGLGTQRASFLIGSIPCTMILAAGTVALCGRKYAPPMRVLRSGMLCLVGASISALAVGVAPTLRQSWLGVLVPIYALVFAQSIIIPPAMAIYLHPWGAEEASGFASGFMSLGRSLVPAALAFGSTCVTARFASSGLLCYIAGILMLAQLLFWPLFGCEKKTSGEALAKGVRSDAEKGEGAPGKKHGENGERPGEEGMAEVGQHEGARAGQQEEVEEEEEEEGEEGEGVELLERGHERRAWRTQKVLGRL